MRWTAVVLLVAAISSQGSGLLQSNSVNHAPSISSQNGDMVFIMPKGEVPLTQLVNLAGQPAGQPSPLATVDDVSALRSTLLQAVAALDTTVAQLLVEVPPLVEGKLSTAQATIAQVDASLQGLLLQSNLGVIADEVGLVVARMIASATPNNLNTALNSKLTASSTCSCFDPKKLEALSTTVTDLLNVTNSTLQCSSQALIYNKDTLQCQVAASAVQCGPVIGGLDANAQAVCETVPDTTPPGSTCVATCNQGYSGGTSATFTCSSSGTWLGELTCAASTCAALSAPTNGAVVSSAVTLGSVSSYSCNPGFTLSGSATTTCMYNGLWSTPAPMCYPDCAAPTSTDPSSATISSATMTYGYRSIVHFSCQAGLVLDGASYASCLSTGQWSSPVPTCVVGCTLPILGNGTIVAPSILLPDSSITFACNQGFTMSGVSRTFCSSSGSWHDPIPRCIPNSCGAPVAPTNGQLSAYTVGTTFDTRQVTCNPNLIPSATITTCQPSGSWSAVACNNIPCPVGFYGALNTSVSPPYYLPYCIPCAPSQLYGSILFRTPSTYTWTVPPCVTSVSVVAVGGGGGGYGSNGGYSSFVNASFLFAGGGQGPSPNKGPGGTFIVPAGYSAGGGKGGAGGNTAISSGYGGGGSGGYLGNGGNGASTSSATDTVKSNATGGGGGGGGASASAAGGGGGGVGVYGLGSTGLTAMTLLVGGTGGSGGGNGGKGGSSKAIGTAGLGSFGCFNGSNGLASSNVAGTPNIGGGNGGGGGTLVSSFSGGGGGGGGFGGGGGAAGNYYAGGGGGALAWMNGFAVVQGMTIQVTVGAGGAGGSSSYGGGGAGGSGAVRIVWGAGRSFPSTLVDTDSYINLETYVQCNVRHK